MSMKLNGLRQSLFCRHAAVHPDSHSGLRDAKLSRPVRDALCLAIDSDDPAAAGISALGLVSSPATVFWAVSEIVVQSLQCVSFRAWTHVFKERFKDIPSLADGEALGPVGYPATDGSCGASLAHSTPRPIFSGNKSLLAVSVSRLQIKFEAPTTLCDAGYHGRARHFSGASAVALAKPDNCCPPTFIEFAFYDEAPEPAAKQLCCGGRFTSSHAVSFLTGDGVVRGCRSLLTGGGLAFNYSTNQCAEVCS